MHNPTTPSPSDEPKTPIRVPKKIPKRIIQNAAGIAVFTCMRNGLWMTGSGGSGILIARKSDGTWSPPSGIMLHTPSLSFIIGVDVYDCVLVVNTHEALESITRSRVVLGEDVGLSSGPLVPLDLPESETEINLKDLGSTVLTYIKSRGQEQMVNMNGCILTERANENERFYESAVSQMDILSGNVSRHVDETRPLSEVIKLAEGRTDFDPSVVGKVAIEPAPGDANIASPNATPQSPRSAFGMPQAHDPDPFGVLALEMAGMEIREAGTRLRPTSSQLDFHPRPISATSSRNFRQSGQTFVSKSNRESVTSNRTVKSTMTDAHTQTDTANTPQTSPSPGRSEDGHHRSSFEKRKEAKKDDEDEEVDYTAVDTTPLKHLSSPPPELDEEPSSAVNVTNATPQKHETQNEEDEAKLVVPRQEAEVDRRSKTSSFYEDEEDKVPSSDNDSSDDNADDADDMSDEEPVVFEVAAVQQRSTQAVASRMIHARGNMVTIPKRIPPPLPARNPARASLQSRSDISVDAISASSPLRYEFSDSELNAEVDSRPTSALSKTAPPSVLEMAAQTPLPDDSDEEEVGEIQETEIPEIVEPASPRHSEDFKDAQPEVEDVKSTETPTQEDEQTGEPSDSEIEIPARSPKRTSKQEPVAQVEEPITEVEEPAAQVEEPATPAPAPKEEANFIVTPPADDTTEARENARVSIDTGATDARSSFENSSYTTPPTSERHFSGDEKDFDATPTKSAKDTEKIPDQETTEDKKDSKTETVAPATVHA